MSLTSSFLQLSSILKPHHPSQFLHGSLPLPSLPKIPHFSSSPPPPPPSVLTVRAMKIVQGRVVCVSSDKTVSVEVVRLAPHPKYKRRLRKKKKYQAHDADNQFQVGDYVQLEKSRPISKTKTFIAIPVPPRNSTRGVDLGLPLQSAEQG
ncbi:30S ribosomal protein S17 [Musa troglodytarum]|uniref:Small ribosomal subunit protein uS17c n=2 Tax=Musa troglodytarum TaxID=320322 RepID=A0A9E7KYY2_9LILI|nr:30S ribosomal protein S17 [Musa troglodytarum]